MSVYPYIGYPYNGYPYNNYPYIGHSYIGYPYYGYPYYSYPYYGLYNDYKINGLLNEYDELNKLAAENQDIYIQNMLDDYKDCNRDIKGNIIPCVLPPMDLSRNNTNREYNYNNQFPRTPQIYPPVHYPLPPHQPGIPPLHYVLPPHHKGIPPIHHFPYQQYNREFDQDMFFSQH
jgi:hypothetical protein